MHIVGAAFSLQIQNVLQMRNFPLEFLNQGVVGGVHLVSCDFLKNLLCPISKFKGRNRLFGVVLLRTDGSDQSCASISTEAVLKQPRQLGVTERGEAFFFALGKALNDFPQARETKIYCF